MQLHVLFLFHFKSKKCDFICITAVSTEMKMGDVVVLVCEQELL